MNSLKVVIPARYASTRLPGKPLTDLCGKAMILRVAERVCQALPTADVWVATDHHQVQEVVAEAGFQVAMTREGHTSGTDRIAELAAHQAWPDDTIIINVQGDEPLIEIDLLQQFSDFCACQKQFSMASVMGNIVDVEDIDNPNLVKLVVNKHNQALYFSRSGIPFVRDEKREAWPLEAFYRHIGIYAYSTKVLQQLSLVSPVLIEELERLEQLRALYLGIPIAMMHWQGELAGGVDTPEDVDRIIQVLGQ